MPGFGNSAGKCQPARSENIMDHGGPAEVVKMVIEKLGLKSPVVVGYDWGGAIALKMGINDSRIFSKIVAFHPSFHE